MANERAETNDAHDIYHHSNDLHVLVHMVQSSAHSLHLKCNLTNYFRDIAYIVWLLPSVVGRKLATLIHHEYTAQ